MMCRARVTRSRGAHHLAGVGQARGVGEVRLGHAELAGALGHLLGEGRLAAGEALGHHDAGVVAGLHDDAVDEVVDPHLGAGLDEHARAFHRLGVRGDEELGVLGDAAVAERLEEHVERHQLRHRGRRDRLCRRSSRTSPCRCRRRSPAPRAPWSRRRGPGAARARGGRGRGWRRGVSKACANSRTAPPRGGSATGIVEPAAQVKIYLWLYQSAARGATRLCGPAPARRPMPRASAASLERRIVGAARRGGEERDDDLGAGCGVDDQRRAPGAAGRGPRPRGRRRRRARRGPPGPRGRRPRARRGPRSGAAAPVAGRRGAAERPQAASRATKRQPSDAAAAPRCATASSAPASQAM